MNSNLEQLIREMEPRLNAGKWAFCELPRGSAAPSTAIATFAEDESLTIILPMDEAGARGLDVRYVAAWITLTVNSDLDAVGFLAAITRALAEAGVSCNAFSAVHHDHLFVPHGDGPRALEILRTLAVSPFRTAHI